MPQHEADQMEHGSMAIVVTERHNPLHSPKNIKVVIDGTEVLNEVPSLATAVAMFFGLVYALNIQYPKKLRYTFEFIQKILMGLDEKKLSQKIHRLSCQLHSP